MIHGTSKSHFIGILILLVLFSQDTSAQGSTPVGWASLNGGTTGGEGGDTIMVTSRGELLSVIGSSTPRVILVQDTIQLVKYERITVGANKSIIGMGTGATLYEGGLEVKGENVILQNLRITGSYDGDWDGKTHSTDAITIRSSNVWVDHCDLSASADGLLDIRADGSNSQGDFVTISWTRFSNHNKVMLFGAGNDEIELRDKLRVTIHHCWFDGFPERGLNQRNPRVRFGDVHLYNNFFDDVDSYCIAARIESDIVVEYNYFRNSQTPHEVLDQGLGLEDADLVARQNVYEFTSGRQDTHGDAFTPADFYEYQVDSTDQLPAMVINGAGLLNDTNNQLPVAPTDTIEMYEDTRSVLLDVVQNTIDHDSVDLRISRIINLDQMAGIARIQDNLINYVSPSSRPSSDSIIYVIADTQGGIDTGRVLVQFGTTTPVQDQIDASATVEIYPNPATNLLTLTYDLPADVANKVQVLDMQGKVHLTRVLRSAATGSHEELLDVSQLVPGSYLLRLNGDQQSYTQRFLIIR